jgi:hypothetical protein
MSDTDSTATLDQADDRAYYATALAIQKRVTDFLAIFNAKDESTSLLPGFITTDRFRGFIERLDRFTDGCCEDCAKIVRHCSVDSALRGTPTLLLSKQIRQDVFEQITTVVNGFESAFKTYDSLPTERAAMLDAQAGQQYPSFIATDLKLVKDHLDRLLDYTCAKCFGGRVSLERQQKALESILTPTTAELDAVIALFRGSMRIEKDAAIADSSAAAADEDDAAADEDAAGDEDNDSGDQEQKGEQKVSAARAVIMIMGTILAIPAGCWVGAITESEGWGVATFVAAAMISIGLAGGSTREP